DRDDDEDGDEEGADACARRDPVAEEARRSEDCRDCSDEEAGQLELDAVALGRGGDRGTEDESGGESDGGSDHVARVYGGFLTAPSCGALKVSVLLGSS